MGTFEDIHKCVICKGDIEVRRNVNGIAYWNRGHNAWPVAKGYCCQKCEDKKVIPRRKLELLLNQKKRGLTPLSFIPDQEVLPQGVATYRQYQQVNSVTPYSYYQSFHSPRYQSSCFLLLSK